MTRLFDAECQGGVVKVAGIVITPTPTILTKGTGSSNGVLLICGEETFYAASNTTDLDETITKVNSALTTISGALPAIASAVGDLGLIAAMNAAKASIDAVVAQLNTLKGNLK